MSFSLPASHTNVEYKRPPPLRVITTGGHSICTAAAAGLYEAVSPACVVACSQMVANTKTDASHVSVYSFSFYRRTH